jgi:hypothetical protein
MKFDLVQWQLIDNNGLPMPWFTHNCLDWIKQQDWWNKNIIMFGAGLGDAWLANRCKKLFVVERNEEWLNKSLSICNHFEVKNIEYLYRPCNDSSGQADYYLQLPDGIDIIINDDAYRTELCQYAIDYFKIAERNGIFICDNWYQSFVWLSNKAVDVMNDYLPSALIFEQKDHTDNDGVNKWKTAVFFIEKK